MRPRWAATALLAVFAAVAIPAGAGASFPGTNGRLAFERRIDDRYQIFTQLPKGSGRMQLTSARNESKYPVWSPDGTQIVFQRRVDDVPQVWVMDQDGSNQTRLTSFAKGAEQGTWSPDGTQIAFLRGPGVLWTMDADGSDALRVLSGGGWVEPMWSPDGTRILMTGPVAGQGYAIFSVDVDGTDVTQLSGASALSYYPDWSPNGKWIAYARNPFGGPGLHRIYVMRSNGHGAHVVARAGKALRAPTWSPDGTRIAYLQASQDGQRIVSIRRTGRDRRVLYTVRKGAPIDLAWQPVQ